MKNLERINARITFFIVLVTVQIVVIIGKLFFTQIMYGKYFITQGERNFLRTESVPSTRGNILDRTGTLLATNRPIVNLYWQATGNRTLTEDQCALIQELETIFPDSGITFDYIKTIERTHNRICIASDIGHKKLSKIIELAPYHPNCVINTEFKRYYPFKQYASHILGYLSREINCTVFGQMGLERTCEELLRGKSGSILKTINSTGKHINILSIQEPAPGADIKTTLDIKLQEICEKIFPQDFAGTILVMDPMDGDILALTSRPNFDPSLFLSPLSHYSWQALQSDNPFLNRAFNACFPPGSIFKLVTISAALEQQILSPDAIFDCKGYVDFCNRKYSCNKPTGHGQITVAQSIAQSCNDLFFKVGKVIDIDILAHYAHLFGLGRPTNIIFTEKLGIVPSKEWKKEVKGEPWWPGETLSVTIGQSFLLVTPVQVARMIGAIFTGLLTKPRILINEPIEREECQITLPTRNFLKKAMKWVVKKGTGQGVTTIEDFKIYAKTSTAQTSTKKKRHLGKQFLEHGWFVAYFRYKDQRPLVLVILVEHAGSAQVAKRVAQKLLIEYNKLMS